MQPVGGKRNQVHVRHAATANHEVPVFVGRLPAEVNGVVHLVIASVVEHHRIPVQGGVSTTPVVQLDKLGGVGSLLIGVNLVDDQTGHRRAPSVAEDLSGIYRPKVILCRISPAKVAVGCSAAGEL